MEKIWYYLKNGEQTGPVSLQFLRQSLSTGALSLESLIWCDGMVDWTPLKAVPEVVLKSVPPKPPKITINAKGPPPLGVQKPFHIVGEIVHLAEGHDLPDSHCVCCGLPSTKRLSGKFGYTPRAVLISAIAPFLLIILYYCLHKERRLSYGLCDHHSENISRFKVASWTCIGLSAPTLFLAFISENSNVVVAFSWLFVILLLASVVLSNFARPLKIVGLENGYIKLAGISKALQNSLSR